MHTRIKLLRGVVIFSIAALPAEVAMGAMHLSGSVSSATTNGPLQALDYRAGSVSVAVDVFTDYLRLGLTHKQAFSDSEGWTVTDSGTPGDTTDDRLVMYQSKSHSTANSIDLTVILYQGETLTPYLMAGVVTKTTKSTIVEEGGTPVQKTEPNLGPNIGAGLAIRLNRAFSLQLSYVVSPGYKLLLPDESGNLPSKPQAMWDRDASIGLKYQL